MKRKTTVISTANLMLLTLLAVPSVAVSSGNTENIWGQPTPKIVRTREHYYDDTEAKHLSQIVKDEQNGNKKPTDAGVTIGVGTSAKAESVAVRIEEPSVQVRNVVIGTNNFYEAIKHTWSAWKTGGGRFVYDHNNVDSNVYKVFVDGIGQVAEWRQYNGTGRCNDVIGRVVWTTPDGKRQARADQYCSNPKRSGAIQYRTLIR